MTLGHGLTLIAGSLLATRDYNSIIDTVLPTLGASSRDTTGIRFARDLNERPALRAFRVGRGGLEPPTYGL